MQSWWIGYARGGREFDVEEAIQALGIEVHVAKIRVAVRSGTNREAIPEDRLVLPNYVFIHCTDEQWYSLAGVKYLAARKMMVPPAEVPRIRRFIQTWALEYAANAARIEADILSGKRLSEYRRGDTLEILDGFLQGEMATFREIVEDDEGHLRVVAETVNVTMLGGRPVVVELDPMDTRRAEVG